MNINYSYFLKENLKLGFFAGYSNAKSGYNGSESDPVGKTNLWAGGLNLSRYYPLAKRFYAAVGAGPGYNHVKSEQSTINNFSLSAFGGLSYFVSKRIALETALLSAGASYTHQKSKDNNSGNTGTTTTKSVDASTSGEITNLNFRVYFLF